MARSQALRRYFVEGCGWEAAAPAVKDPDRVADPSTLRRWFRSLDSSLPPFSYVRRTMLVISALLGKTENLVHDPLPLRGHTTFAFLARFSLQLEDLKLADAQLHVLGKGRKQRTLPLPGEIMEVLQSYLRLERPLTNSAALFVSLKGRRRGQPMTPAGLRSLFRHHRGRSQVSAANPHRFRHTFGANMVRAGISLPALQLLMGHAQIHTTLLYVQLAPSDVWREYTRVVANRSRLPYPPML